MQTRCGKINYHKINYQCFSSIAGLFLFSIIINKDTVAMLQRDVKISHCRYVFFVGNERLSWKKEFGVYIGWTVFDKT